MTDTASPERPRLTSLSHGGGCGCKIAPGVLADLLKRAAPTPVWPQLMIGNDTADDAAVSDAAPTTTRRSRSKAPKDEATALLERPLRLGHDKSDGDDDWLHSSAVKQQMRRMDPSFSEKALGFSSFSDFVKSRDAIAELEETGHERLVRLRDR